MYIICKRFIRYSVTLTHANVKSGSPESAYGTKYSRMGQVKFVKDSL